MDFHNSNANEESLYNSLISCYGNIYNGPNN